MAEKLQIWNMALGFVGTRTVASESEHTQEAIQCRLFWDNARRQALRDYPWNFAQRRAKLANVPIPDGWEHEYRAAYALPTDVIKAHKVKDHGRSEQRFVLGYDQAQGRKVLMTDAQEPVLHYTADVHDVALGDDLFAGLVSRKLAAMIAVPLLKNNNSKVQELEQLYMASIPQAYEADASEGKEAEKSDSWVMSRGGFAQ